MHHHDDMIGQALSWHREGRGAVLATVIETWGSAPRPVGSQMAVSGAGDLAGSVSGGCVEAAVVAEARGALAEGRARVASYGVSDDDAFSVGLACGGTIRVLVEPVGTALPEALLADLAAARAARQPVAYTVDLRTWERALVTGDGPHEARLRAARSGVEGDLFVGVFAPTPRLVIVGAVQIAQPLVTLARLCEHLPLIIEPRTAFGSAARFPGETIIADWPDVALAALAPDARTAVVTLTHEARFDDLALVAALRSQAYYIGCLGSTRTHAARAARLRALGIDEGDLARLHAPVGLRIGAKGPAEIAVAIMAEITAVLRQV